jgi:hypothetical protein
MAAFTTAAQNQEKGRLRLGGASGLNRIAKPASPARPG